MGRKGGHAGVINTFSRFTGVYPPPTCGQKRGSLTPLVHRGPVKPNDVLGKNKSVRVLAKVCGHLTSASELNLWHSGARAGSSRRRVWPIPPFDRKSRGYAPLLPLAIFGLAQLLAAVGGFNAYAQVNCILLNGFCIYHTSIAEIQTMP